MITLKKSELEVVLMTISAYDKDSQQLVSGLLKENLSLGTKRKLQKIHKAVHTEYKQLIEDVKEVQKEAGEDKEKLQIELQNLIDEEVTIEVEHASLENIESISTNANYNFDLIEKIAA